MICTFTLISAQGCITFVVELTTLWAPPLTPRPYFKLDDKLLQSPAGHCCHGPVPERPGLGYIGLQTLRDNGFGVLVVTLLLDVMVEWLSLTQPTQLSWRHRDIGVITPPRTAWLT